MNNYLQIGFGLILGVVLTIVLLMKRKAFCVKYILLTLLLLISCGGFLYAGIKQAVPNGPRVSRLSKKERMEFANALFTEGAYEEALEVIGEYGAEYGYDDECRKLEARIYLAQGDYVRADGIYRHLGKESVLQVEETQFAADKKNTDAGDLAVLDYLTKSGEKIEEYGFTQTSYQEIQSSLQKDPQEILSGICTSIGQEYAIDDGMDECAKAVYEVSTAYEPSEEEGVSASSKYRRAFDKAKKENPELFSVDCVEKAQLKANVLSGDFERITESIGKSSSYHELMVAAELYMGGFVGKSHFPADYQSMTRDEASAVGKQMSRVYSRSSGLSVQEKKKLKERVDAVSAQLKDPSLAAVKEQLLKAAETEAGTDRTKVCLELAKIENYFQNEAATDRYLNEAIYYSQDCEDDSYASAMAQIISVINNDASDETENIKNVSEYVQMVLDHSMTLDIPAMVSPAGQSDDSADAVDEGEDAPVDFARTAVDYVSRAKSAVSIGKIDTSAFEHISARIQISSEDTNSKDQADRIKEFERSLQVYDCGVRIEDFSLSKIDYSASNILLCCDVSGSMEESIQNLRDSVSTFIADKNPEEHIAVVTFNGSIVEMNMFGSSDEQLLAMADAMVANGETDMFSAVVSCLDGFPNKAGENNVLILMTDGQDGNPKSSDVIYEEIGGLAKEKNVSIYTMGLGSEVDTAYLSTIAASGNGDFVYISDSTSLTSFYEMLHGQMHHQYELSYDALDTVTVSDRVLEAVLPLENVRDSKTYSLKNASEETDSPEEEDSSEGGMDDRNVLQGMSVTGMSPKHIYKGQQNVGVKLKGTKFSPDSTASVKLNGNIDYTIETKYVDEETYQMTIPASIAADTYDVEVTIDGKKSVLQDGFSVLVQESEQKIAFGPYVFTSAEVIQNASGDYTLRGGVEMNGWLHFKGDVILSGDIENGSSITVLDEEGSYVKFDPAVAEGAAHFLAELGVSIPLPALQRFQLYNDPLHLYDYSNYKVDDISIGILKIHQIMRFDSPVIRLYPNSLGVYYTTGTTDLPYQDTILNKYSKNEELFKLDFNGSAQITDKKIGLVLDFSYEDSDKEEFNHSLNIREKRNQIICLFNSPIYFNGSLKAKINTLKEEYCVGAVVRFAFIADQSGLGLEIQWKGIMVDSVKFSLDARKGKKLLIAGMVPIEANNFSFQVSDIKKSLESGNFAGLKFTGSVNLSSGQVKEYFPKVAEHLGKYKDFALFKMPNTTASIRLSPIQIEANAELHFLGIIKLLEAALKIGEFNYTNELLDLDSTSVHGISASLKKGVSWENSEKSAKLELTGTGEFSGHSRFLGLTETGNYLISFKWWMLHMEENRDGKITFGLYTRHDGKKELVAVYKYKDKNGKTKGNFYYVDEDWNFGSKSGFLN